jgi:hypothetical protein
VELALQHPQVGAHFREYLRTLDALTDSAPRGRQSGTSLSAGAARG